MSNGLVDGRGSSWWGELRASRGLGRGRFKSRSRYDISPLKTLLHSAIGSLPPLWREGAAERLLRRPGAPAPAAEHVIQYQLGVERAKRSGDIEKGTSVAKGADLFYERQYRQFLNPTMGAFAMSATMALIGGGHRAEGRLWSRRRRTAAVMLDAEASGGPPIIVLDAQTVAVPMLLPFPLAAEKAPAALWLAGQGGMPQSYRKLAEGVEVSCAETGVRAYERRRAGALIEILDATAGSRKLAVLGLCPEDSDAMGLHLTLFDVRIHTQSMLEQNYGLPPDALGLRSSFAETANALLVFCVGAIEEAFTQCSQNLFIKRRQPAIAARRCVAEPKGWRPDLALDRLLDAQFESFQITVSASGLPGASPRNGDRGRAALVERRGGKTYVLIPYHPGNAVHGHAAKLWSNPYGSLLIWDDSATRAAVTISGPSRIISHATAKRDFAASVAKGANIKRRNGVAASDPEYWFLLQVEEIALQRETLALATLDPARPTCSINAGGHALFDKKPAYFAANGMPAYDMELQHRREAAGRPVDPTGEEYRRWSDGVRDVLEARVAHLASATRVEGQGSAQGLRASPQ